VTIDAAAVAAHRVIHGLWTGSATGIRFGKVIEVGHSLGSVVVWQEAINYPGYRRSDHPPGRPTR
jgi:hypothetical protein